MNWHVEVIRLECISHLPKCTQGIIPVRLLEAKRLLRFATFLEVEGKKRENYLGVVVHPSCLGFLPYPNLSQALGAPPVSFRNVVQRRDQAEGVVAVVTAVAQ